MIAPDFASVLADHWPVPVFGCECTPVDDESGEKAVLETSWEAHVAAALHAEVVAAQAEAWDEGWAAAGTWTQAERDAARRFEPMPPLPPNPYRAALAALAQAGGGEA